MKQFLTLVGFLFLSVNIAQANSTSCGKNNQQCDIEFVGKLPVWEDMQCGGETEVHTYTVKSNVPNITINKSIVTEFFNDTSPDSTISLSGCEGEITQGATCTITVTLTSAGCDTQKEAINFPQEVDRDLVVVANTWQATRLEAEIELQVTNVSLTKAYIANGSQYTISICTLNPNGTFAEACATFTDTTHFNYPVDVILNDVKDKAYIANNVGNTITVCTVDGQGELSGCAPFWETIYSSFGGLRLQGNYLYDTDYSFERVTVCPIASGVCNTASVPDANGRLVFDPTGNIAYVASFDNAGIYICDNSNPTSFNCSNVPFQDGITQELLGMDINSAGTHVYAAGAGGSVFVCEISGSTLNTCVGQAATSINEAVSNLFMHAGNFGYIPNPQDANLIFCNVDNSSNGAISDCQPSPTDPSFVSPISVWVTAFQ